MIFLIPNILFISSTRPMKIALLIICVFCSPLLSASPLLDVGLVKDKKGVVKVIEKHTTTLNKDDQLVTLRSEYYSPSTGQKFAELTSDFTKKPYLPEYKTVDDRFGRMESLEINGTKVILKGQKKKDEKLVTQTWDFKDEYVSGQGLHNLVRTNFNELLSSKKPREIEFITPVDQKSYGFRVAHLKTEGDVSTFKVSFDSWFLRLVAPSIDTVYRKSDRRLLQFKGPYHLMDENFDSMSVVIDYKFDDQAKKILAQYKIN